jgi:hypothetical protein
MHESRRDPAIVRFRADYLLNAKSPDSAPLSGARVSV